MALPAPPRRPVEPLSGPVRRPLWRLSPLWLGWAGPIAAAAIGAVLRLWDLGAPHAFVFDETYYAKDALGLVRFGTEQATVPDADGILLATAPDVAGADVFTGEPSFVVHPPVGKWLIGLGEMALGVQPVGWRLAAAIASVLSILILGRVVLRLTGRALLGTIAAGLLAFDGLHLTVGRTALLDTFLMLFVLAAFAALLIDRDHTRARYLRLGPPGRAPSLRVWRIAAGVLLGLACGVKWSALWYVAAFGLLTVLWEIASRRRAGDAHPWRSALLTDALPAAIAIVGVGALVYLATWSGWILTADGWGRQWRADAGTGLVPQWLGALWHYHEQIYGFHVGLDQEHPYEASPWGWLLQARPTSFFYDGDGLDCGAGRCSSAVIALGNPVIWWAGSAALLHQAYRAVFVRDWRSSAVVVGVAAGWLPWLLFPDRTVFGFYAVVLAPFLVSALTLSLGAVIGAGDAPARVVAGTAPGRQLRRSRSWRILAVGGFLLLVVVAAWWFFPVWTGQEIPFTAWQRRMWFPSWI